MAPADAMSLTFIEEEFPCGAAARGSSACSVTHFREGEASCGARSGGPADAVSLTFVREGLPYEVGAQGRPLGYFSAM